LLVAVSFYFGSRLTASPNETKEVGVDAANHEGGLDGIGVIPFLGSLDSLDSETAAKCGITGYLLLDVAPGTPKELCASGGKVSITLILKFVSFRKDVTETKVIFDSRGSGLKIEVPYEDRLLCLNDLVSYEPSGTVIVKIDQILQVKMIISVPTDYPHVSFPLGAVGVTSDVPISDRVDVTARI
jgi:hypothetical protein